LLLLLLGVDQETVLADFRLSERVGLPGRLPAMYVLLDEIEAAGGVEPYLESIGVASETQRRIRKHLLEGQ
jgi:hypothetical protein